MGTRGEAYKAALWGLALSLMAMVAAIVLAVEAARGWGTESVLANFGVLTALLTSIFGNRAKLGRRAAGISALATLAWVPLLLLVARVLRGPVIATEWLCGTAAMGALLAGPFLLLPLAAVSSFVATRVRFPSLDGLLRGAALLAVAWAAFMAAVAVAHSGRPTADRYLEWMPVVGSVAPGESFTMGDGTVVTYRATPSTYQGPSGAPPNGLYGGNEARPQRAGAQDIAEASSRVFDCALDRIRMPYQDKPASFQDSPCPPLTLHHDVRSGVWVATHDDREPIAWKDGNKRLSDIGVDDIKASISAPVGDIAAALIGAAVGAVFFFLGLKLDRGKRTVDAIVGNLGDDGWVTIPGAAPARIADASRFAVGPLLLRVSGGTPATYRSTGGGMLLPWRKGTLDELRAELQGCAVSRYAFALTWAVLCASPLLSR